MSQVQLTRIRIHDATGETFHLRDPPTGTGSVSRPCRKPASEPPVKGGRPVSRCRRQHTRTHTHTPPKPESQREQGGQRNGRTKAVARGSCLQISPTADERVALKRGRCGSPPAACRIAFVAAAAAAAGVAKEGQPAGSGGIRRWKFRHPHVSLGGTGKGRTRGYIRQRVNRPLIGSFPF